MIGATDADSKTPSGYFERSGTRWTGETDQTTQCRSTEIAPGRIILAAGNGQNNSQIAREMPVDLNTVRLWRTRWLDLQPFALDDLGVEERLEDLPRPGAPARITADQICQITQMACEKPEASERPISQWTAREIADEVQRRGIVEQILARHAARLLKRRRS